MHAVIRTYTGKGAKELFDLLEKRKTDVESLIRSVKGFINYSLIRTDDGGISVTVCRDKAGTDESVQKKQRTGSERMRPTFTPARRKCQKARSFFN